MATVHAYKNMATTKETANYIATRRQRNKEKAKAYIACVGCLMVSKAHIQASILHNAV